MEDKKKKGFWSSLFAPKPCSCSCGSEIEEIKDESKTEVTQENKQVDDVDHAPKCDCDGKC